MIATIIGVTIAFIFLWINPRGNGVRAEFKKHMNDDEDPDKFAEWAFGADYDVLSSGTLAKRWNLLHGDKYQIDPSRIDGPSNDAPHMIEIWRTSIK